MTKLAAQLPTLYRDATDEDMGAVVSWWKASCRRRGGPSGLPIPAAEIARRAARNTCTVMTPADMPDHIIGWVLWEPRFKGTPVVHYMAIRRQYQGKGFGTLLASHAGVVRGCDVYVTEQPNPTVEKMLKAKARLRWVPYSTWVAGEPFRVPCDSCGRKVWATQECPDCAKADHVVVEIAN